MRGGRIAGLAAAPVVLIMIVATSIMVGLFGGQQNATEADAAECVVQPAAPTPGAASPAPAAEDAPASTFGGQTRTAPQLTVVQTILTTASAAGITERGGVIALQTVMQESTFNPAATNGNATGAFQQIAPGPIGKSGKPAYVGYDRHDVASATKGWVDVLLKRAPDYQTSTMSNEAIAEEVQQSTQGELYAKWQSMAEALVAAFWDGSAAVSCVAPGAAGGPGPVAITLDGPAMTIPANEHAGDLAGKTIKGVDDRTAKAMSSALQWLGTTYAWGGGGPSGPTKGIRDGGVADSYGDYNKIGFDCSGLTEYAWAQAGASVGGDSRSQFAALTHVPWSQAQPGDLIFFGAPIHHVALFLGVIDGVPYMVEAPQSGSFVHVAKVYDGDRLEQVGRP